MTGFRDAAAEKGAIYRFGPFTVDRAGFRVTRNGEPVRIEPKALEVLIYLIEHRDRVVTKDELLDAVWKGTFVTSNALTRVIAHLRKTLGDDADSPRFIETVPTRGYRFIGTESEAAPASVPAVPVAPSQGIPAARNLTRVATIAISIIVALLVVTFVGSLVRRSRFDEPTIRPSDGRVSSRLPARRLIRPPGLHIFPAFSPDGARIAYSSNSAGLPQIYITSITGDTSTQLTRDKDGAIQPSWSPDGKSIAYTSLKRGGIRTVSVKGGAPQRLTDFGSRPSWGPDGDEIAFQSGNSLEFGGTAFEAQPPSTLWIVNVSTGRAVPLTKRGKPAGGHGAPSWRSDGKRVAFVSCEIEQCVVYTIGRHGSALHEVVRRSVPLASPVFSPDGRTLYNLVNRYNGAALVATRLGDDGQAVGSTSVLRGSGPGIMQHLTISRDGTRIAWSLVEQTSNLVVIRADGSGAPLEITQNTSTRGSFPSFSPDGTKIAWSAVGAGDDSGIWIAAADGQNAKALTVGPAYKQNVQWSRDGWEVFYFMWEDGPTLIAVSLINGRSDRVTQLPRDASWPAISPDRKRVAFNRSINGIASVWVKNVDGSGLRRLTEDATLTRYPVWSPTGKQIAVQVRHPDGSSSVGIVPVGGGRVRVLTSGGEALPYSWSPDDRFVAYAALRDGVWNIWSVRIDDGTSQPLTHNDSAARWMRYPAWSPDGRQIVFESGTVSSETWLSNPLAVQ